MKKNVIIVTTGRTGSSWLENCFKDKLGYNVCRISTSELRGNEFEFLVDTELDQRIEFLRTYKAPWVCKIIIDDWDYFPLHKLAEIENTQLVWVWRKDTVDFLLSYAMGVKTRVFNVSEAQTNYTTPDTIELEPWQREEFTRMIEIRNRHWDYYNHLFDYVLEYSTMFESNPWNFSADDALGKLNKYTPDHIKQAKAILDTL